MHKLLLSAVLGMAMLSGCSKSADQAESHAAKVPEMSVDEVDKGLTAGTLTAIDCNGDGTRKKHGALPGAVLISDDEAYSPSELPADKTRKLVFYCSGPT